MLSKLSRIAPLRRAPFRFNAAGVANRNFSASRVSLFFKTVGVSWFLLCTDSEGWGGFKIRNNVGGTPYAGETPFTVRALGVSVSTFEFRVASHSMLTMRIQDAEYALEISKFNRKEVRFHEHALMGFAFAGLIAVYIPTPPSNLFVHMY